MMLSHNTWSDILFVKWLKLYFIFFSYTAILCFIPILISIVSIMDPRLTIYYMFIMHVNTVTLSVIHVTNWNNIRNELSFLAGQDKFCILNGCCWLQLALTRWPMLLKWTLPNGKYTDVWGHTGNTIVSILKPCADWHYVYFVFWNILRFICMDFNF